MNNIIKNFIRFKNKLVRNFINKCKWLRLYKIIYYTKIKKGKMASYNGLKYEVNIWNICSNIKNIITNEKFCNIEKKLLGGSTNNADVECYLNNNKIYIEVKKSKTPDWMQLSIKPNDQGVWCATGKNKIPNDAIKLFEKLINNIKIFNSKIPPFFEKNITHKEWKEIKKSTNDFNDIYIDCPNDTIAKLYSYKKCSYIQISDFGLYHLDNDICNFNVPYFECQQVLRIRTKIHTSNNINNFMYASVTLSAKPKNINKLNKSMYSLDNYDLLPNNLIKINN